MQKNLKIDYYLMISIGLIFFTILFLICYFVAPFTDESFPIATALRFVQGQIPFIDDSSPFIPLALLLYPVVKLSLWLHQGTNELILFIRHCYIAFSFLVSIYTFFLIRRKFPLILSFFIALAIGTFHPFGVNNFHYDTLLTLLWSSIVFQFYSFQFSETIRKSHLIIFSLFNLVLCFAYPTFLFFLVPYFLLFYPFNRHSNKMLFSHFLVACFGAVVFIWIIFYHFNVQLQDIQNTLDFLPHLRTYNNQIVSDKFLELFHRLGSKYSQNILIASVFLLIGYYGRKYWFILLPCILAVLYVPFFAVNIQHAVYSDAFAIFNYMGFLGCPLFLIFLRNDPEAKKMFCFIWVPSFIAGIITSISAGHLDLNFIIGFFPAFILSYVFIYLIIEKNMTLRPSLNYFLTRMVLICGLIELIFFQWNYIYGSIYVGMPIYKNSIKIETKNPFSGLYVAPADHGLVMDLQKDIQKLDVSSVNQFVYFGAFSGGYLFPTNLKPGDYFLYATYDQGHFGKEIRTPNYVFDFSKLWHTPAEYIDIYLKGAQYKKIATRQFYDIYASEHTLVLSQNLCEKKTGDCI